MNNKYFFKNLTKSFFVLAIISFVSQDSFAASGVSLTPCEECCGACDVGACIISNPIPGACGSCQFACEKSINGCTCS